MKTILNYLMMSCDIDFSIFYKYSFTGGNVNELPEYDFFFSAFDNCPRTKEIFGKIKSKERKWFVFPHHANVNPEIIPIENVYFQESFKEDDYFQRFFEESNISPNDKVCLDITGFIRPHLLYFIKYLNIIGLKKIDLLYTEPIKYIDADETKFSGFIDDIRIIEGFSAAKVNPNTENDLLIISSGYDDKLIAKISQHKSYCKKKYYILGFPSLQPDMYQESILKINNAKESIGEIKQTRFSPAFDPFITAQVINEIIDENPGSTNIYLCPISTKPQTIGIVLFYLWNKDILPINIIFPFSNSYATKHAEGIKRTWRYTFEFP